MLPTFSGSAIIYLIGIWICNIIYYAPNLANMTRRLTIIVEHPEQVFLLYRSERLLLRLGRLQFLSRQEPHYR